MEFKPECIASAIGSLPHKSPGPAIDAVMNYLPDLPVWPQLPSRSYLEGMCPQYSEGMPAIKIDLENKSIRAETGSNLLSDMEKFYENYLSEDLSRFAISEKFAPGIHEFAARIKASGKNFFAVKGQVTGPITFGLTVCDENGKASYFNDMLKDALIKTIGRKAKWQAVFLSDSKHKVLIFIDEPYLQSFGSATVPISGEDVTASLNDVIGEIHSAGAAAGIHCCGNTDWALLANTDVDVVNFDALLYAESLSLYPKEIGAFLERGGAIAWGITPSSSDIDGMDLNALTGEFRRAVGLLIKKGFKEDFILERALITPTCGAGGLTIPQSEKMLRLTSELSKILRGSE